MTNEKCGGFIAQRLDGGGNAFIVVESADVDLAHEARSVSRAFIAAIQESGVALADVLRWRRRGAHWFLVDRRRRRVIGVLRRIRQSAETSYYTRPVLWDAFIVLPGKFIVPEKRFLRLAIGRFGTLRSAAAAQVEKVYGGAPRRWDVDGRGDV